MDILEEVRKLLLKYPPSPAQEKWEEKVAKAGDAFKQGILEKEGEE